MVLYINTKDPKVVTVSLKKGGEVVKSLSEENEYGSEVLLPLIERLLKSQKLNFEDLNGIEAEEGPGSFTGLKVGASVAQVLGYALKIPVNGKVGKPITLRYT
ncbi:MAG: tRNA (adenosine(37)-N6)-threonylcarbamoyltransferase complex dimerization subunit type 1 TsaB [Candidatus Daviesbacteria bacterium]